MYYTHFIYFMYISHELLSLSQNFIIFNFTPVKIVNYAVKKPNIDNCIFRINFQVRIPKICQYEKLIKKKEKNKSNSISIRDRKTHGKYKFCLKTHALKFLLNFLRGEKVASISIQ